MASTVGSLFGIDLGTDRQDILSQIVKERQASNIAKTQGLGKFAGLAQSGMESAQMFGDIVKQSVGVKDPRLAQQDNRDQAVAKANARIKDPSDQEEVYRVMAEEFQAAGLTKEALVMSGKLSEVKMKKASEARSEKELSMREKEFGLREEEFKYKKGKKTFQQVTQYTGENDEPLSMDTETGQYYSGGKPYKGKLKPKPSSNPFGQFLTPGGAGPKAGPEGKPATRKEYNPKTGKIEEVPIK